MKMCATYKQLYIEKKYKKLKIVLITCFFGAGGRNRTHDLLITSHIQGSTAFNPAMELVISTVPEE